MIQYKKLDRTLFLYWLQMTVMCGALSFVYGFYITNGAVLPMIAGILSIAAALAWLDSRHKVQRFFYRHPKFYYYFEKLLWLHVVIEVVALIIKILNYDVLLVVYWWIGLLALALVEIMTSASFLKMDTMIVEHDLPTLLGAYVATLLTGFFHIILISVFAACVTLLKRLYRKIKLDKAMRS